MHCEKIIGNYLLEKTEFFFLQKGKGERTNIEEDKREAQICLFEPGGDTDHAMAANHRLQINAVRVCPAKVRVGSSQRPVSFAQKG